MSSPRQQLSHILSHTMVWMNNQFVLAAGGPLIQEKVLLQSHACEVFTPFCAALAFPSHIYGLLYLLGEGMIVLDIRQLLMCNRGS